MPPTRQQQVRAEKTGVAFIPDQDVGNAKVGQGLPGLDEAQLGLRQRELGHVLVGFQDPGGELQDHTGEGLPKSLRPDACPHQGDRMLSLGRASAHGGATRMEGHPLTSQHI